MRTKINWKFVIVCVLMMAALGLTIVGLRKFNRQRQAARGLTLGSKAYQEGKWAEVADQLGRYLAIHQDDVDSLLKYAESQLKIRPLKRSQVSQAVATYHQILRLQPGNIKAATPLADIYLQTNQPGEAMSVIQKALEINTDPQLRMMVVRILDMQRSYAEAENRIREELSQHADNISAYDLAGQLIENHPSEYKMVARDIYNGAVEKNPRSSYAWVIGALYAASRGDKALALSDLQKAASLIQEKEPENHLDVMVKMALCYIELGDKEAAEKWLKRIREKDASSFAGWQLWGVWTQTFHENDRMLEIAQEALTSLHEPDYWDFMPQVVQLYLGANALDLAEDAIRQLRQKEMFLDKLDFWEGLVAERRGDTYKAVQCWRKSLGTSGISSQVRQSLAQVLWRQGDEQGALSLWRQLAEEQPKDVNIQLECARALFQSNRWSDALSYVQRVLQQDANHYQAGLLYWQCYLRVLLKNDISPQSQEWDKIKVGLEKIQKGHVVSSDYLRTQLQLAMARREYEPARHYLKQLQQSYPEDRENGLLEIQILLAEKQEDAAINKMRQLIDQHPQWLAPVTMMAYLYDQQGQQENCQQIIKAALERNRDQALRRQLITHLARYYDKWRRDDEGYRLLADAAKEMPDDIQIKRMLLHCPAVVNGDSRAAQLLVDQMKAIEGEKGWQWRYEQAQLWLRGPEFRRQYPQMCSLLQENIGLNPADQASRLLLAMAHDQAGQASLAISTYRQAYQRSSQELGIIIPYVTLLNRMGQYGEANEVLNKTAAINRSHPMVVRLQLQSDLGRGDFNAGITAMENLLQKNPEDVQTALVLAMLQIRQTHYAEAESLLNKILAQQPDASVALRAMVDLKVRQGKTSEALQLCKQRVEKKADAESYLLLAYVHHLAGDSLLARQNYDQAARIDAKNPEVWLNKSEFHQALGQWDEAIAAMQTFCQLRPEDVMAQKQQIRLLLASSQEAQKQRGQQLLEKMKIASPEDMDLQIMEVRVSLAIGTLPALSQATQTLIKLTEKEPGTAELWLLLGQLKLQVGEPGAGMDYVLRGLTYLPDHRELLLLKARMEQLRSPPSAVATLKMLRDRYPEDLEIGINLAEALMASGNPAAAVTLLSSHNDRVLPFQKRIVDMTLATALYKAGEKDRAKMQLETLYASDKDSLQPLSVLSRLLLEDRAWGQLDTWLAQCSLENPGMEDLVITVAQDLMRQPESEPVQLGEKVLQRVLNYNPQNTRALHVLAMSQHSGGKMDAALATYRQIIQIQSDDYTALNNLAWLLCEVQRDYESSLTLVQRAIACAPPAYIDVYDTRGMIWFRKGDMEKAVQDFRRCVERYAPNAPGLAGAYFHLGRAMGQNHAASDTLKYLHLALQKHKEVGGLTDTEVQEVQQLCNSLSPHQE